MLLHRVVLPLQPTHHFLISNGVATIQVSSCAFAQAEKERAHGDDPQTQAREDRCGFVPSQHFLLPVPTNKLGSTSYQTCSCFKDCMVLTSAQMGTKHPWAPSISGTGGKGSQQRTYTKHKRTCHGYLLVSTDLVWTTS